MVQSKAASRKWDKLHRDSKNLLFLDLETYLFQRFGTLVIEIYK
jgi:hypothetical protein